MSAARVAVCSFTLLACGDAAAPAGFSDAGTIDAHDAAAFDVVAVPDVKEEEAGKSCIDTQGNGIRYFGAYTKNTQTNYDFDTWAGFHQDFLTSFASCDTWSNASSSDWGFDIMNQQPAGENIQEIVCLTTSEDPSLQHVAAGTYDSYFQKAGQLFLEHGYRSFFRFCRNLAG